jgi:Cu/Ag efflux protein CusF
MGVVKAIDQDSISIETTDKAVVHVSLNGETEYQKSAQPAKLSDLHTGDRVVVHADQHDGNYVAVTVAFGPPAKH